MAGLLDDPQAGGGLAGLFGLPTAAQGILSAGQAQANAPDLRSALHAALQNPMLGWLGTSNMGGGNVTNMQQFVSQRAQDALKRQNLAQAGQDGYYGVSTLSNRYTVGRVAQPGSGGDRLDPDYVLLSPQGTPVLYGNSAAELLKRGFHPDDNVSIISGEGAPR